MRTRGARGLLLAGAIADYSFNFVFVYIIDHKAVGIHAAHILGPDVVRQPGGIGLKMLRSRWIDGPGPDTYPTIAPRLSPALVWSIVWMTTYTFHHFLSAGAATGET